MEWANAKYLKEWIDSIFLQYDDFKKSKKYRCKIVDIKINAGKYHSTLHVLISGVKNQIVQFSPKELVTNDSMLDEFSSSDVRAITFLAFKESYSRKKPPISAIIGQDFDNGKTIFIIKKLDEDGESRKSAHSLYSDSELLDEFNQNDIKNIIHTAIVEQAMNDFLMDDD